MISSFCENWYVRPEGEGRAMPEDFKPVTLPHDAMIEARRASDLRNGAKKGFFPNGSWEYVKFFDAPSDWADKRVLLRFQGAASNAIVFVNGSPAASHPYAYTEFTVDLKPFLNLGGKNSVRVAVHTGDDSRWYTGAGLYRDVDLIVTDETHILEDGVQIRTESMDDAEARILIETKLINEKSRALSAVRLRQEIFDASGARRAVSEYPVTLPYAEVQLVRQRLYIDNPELWSTESPNLYVCRTSLLADDCAIDSAENAFGVRVIALSARRGFQLNGKTVKLRGACIHHDNGVIGARACVDADRRKVRKLKEAGFNAIRSAHHPMGRGLLDACDREGMLVLDELFDMWKVPKSCEDYANHFEKCWREDARSMIDKDFNHPSVILYSVGNEIFDLSIPGGAATGRGIVEWVNALDPTRFTTLALNGAYTLVKKWTATPDDPALPPAADKRTPSEMEMEIRRDLNSAVMDETIGEACSLVDVAGYNYMTDRYQQDVRKYPDRVIVGTESFAMEIGRIWPLVSKNASLIGDFTWTGWDYLGEAGIGKIDHEGNLKGLGFFGNYPWATGHCGDIDITGYRLPASYFREIVFGFRKDPYIAVGRPEFAGMLSNPSPWGWTGEISGWSFPGYEGRVLSVEVYADADKVELFLNGASLGRKPAGEAVEYKAVFSVPYAPGNLTAVAFRDGQEIGRVALRSASDRLELHAEAEKDSVLISRRELVYVHLTLTDEDGTPQLLRDRDVTLKLEGPAELLGFGSGASQTTQGYCGFTHATHDGRAFAVLRPTGAGEIRVTASADGCAPAGVSVRADE